jgi:hypothetical protein
VADIAAAAVRPGSGDEDLHEELVGADYGLADAREEVGKRYTSLSLGARDDRLGLERDEGRSHVGGGGGIADVAADGGEVSHLDGAEEGRALRHRGIAVANARVLLDLARGHGSADAEPLRVALQYLHAGHPGEIDDPLGHDHAVFHLGEEIGAPGEKLRLGTALGEEAQAVVQAFRQSKLESSHAEPPEMSDRFQVSG